MAVAWRNKSFTWCARTNVIVLKPVERLALIGRALKTVLIEDGLEVLNRVLMKRCSSLQLHPSLRVASRL